MRILPNVFIAGCICRHSWRVSSGESIWICLPEDQPGTAVTCDMREGCFRTLPLEGVSLAITLTPIWTWLDILLTLVENGSRGLGMYRLLGPMLCCFVVLHSSIYECHCPETPSFHEAIALFYVMKYNKTFIQKRQSKQIIYSSPCKD